MAPCDHGALGLTTEISVMQGRDSSIVKSLNISWAFPPGYFCKRTQLWFVAMAVKTDFLLGFSAQLLFLWDYSYGWILHRERTMNTKLSMWKPSLCIKRKKVSKTGTCMNTYDSCVKMKCSTALNSKYPVNFIERGRSEGQITRDFPDIEWAMKAQESQ